MGKLLSSAALGWFGRRILDWGGWLGTFIVSMITLYNSLPPSTQDSIDHVLTGNWQDITLGALIPIGMLVWSQIQSFLATVKPQVVTTEGEKIAIQKDLPANKRVVVEEIAATAAEEKKRQPGLLERLFGKRG